MGKTILFVYGTLKSGQRNNHLLANQKRLGDAMTTPHYRLYELGRYPGLVMDKDHGLAVKGELWEVSDCCLEELDDYEEVPNLYVRDRVEIAGDRGWVQTFFYDETIPSDARSGDRWPMKDTEH